MRDVHVEKFLLLPFSIGCDSKSSVATAATSASAAAAIATTQSRKHRHPKLSERKGEWKKPSRVRSKNNLGVSQELYRLIKRLLVRLSKLFVYEEGIEHIEKEIEIGFPTDVKHVTHIGLDGLTMINNSFSTSKRLNSTEINAQFPSISAEQFEIAMAAQTCRSSSTRGIELVDDGSFKRSLSSST